MKKLDKTYSEKDYIELPGRSRFMDSFSDELLNSRENLNYAVCGSWGVGKTFLIKKLEEVLYEKMELINNSIDYKQNIFFLYLDAWSMDHFESPLVAFVDTIMKNDKLEKQFNSDEFWRSVTINWNFGLSFLGLSAEFNTELERRQILSQVKYSTILRDRIQLTLSEYMKSKNFDKVILIIDELDRCRPDFTIKLLEQYKHFTESFNRMIEIVYVIDDAQLLASLKAIYGNEYDVDTYIHKIFDCIVRVPHIDEKTFYMYFEKSFDLRNDFTFKFLEEFSEVAELTFRDFNRLKKITDRINKEVLKEDIMSASHPEKTRAMVLLAILNLRNPVLVRSVLSYGESFDVLWNAIDKLTIGKCNSDSKLKEALTILVNPNPKHDIDMIRDILYGV